MRVVTQESDSESDTDEEEVDKIRVNFFSKFLNHDNEVILLYVFIDITNVIDTNATFFITMWWETDLS